MSGHRGIMARRARATPVRRRHGFTLIELIVAGVLTAMVLGTLSATIGQLSRAKSTCKERLDAHLRADMALNQIRRDVASIIRADDLFYTRLLLLDDDVNSVLGELPRDEIVVFCTRLRPIRSLEFNGEGSEYETQYRIDEETGVPVLWQRRDAFPDEYPLAGGQAEPLVENILSLEIEVYDGDQWYDTWDSDIDGLPYAVRVTVMASGARPEQSPYEAVTATLQTVIALDRVPPSVDQYALSDDELEELDARVLIDPALAGEADGNSSNRNDQNGDGRDDTTGEPIPDNPNIGGGGRGGGRNPGGKPDAGDIRSIPNIRNGGSNDSSPDRNIDTGNPPT